MPQARVNRRPFLALRWIIKWLARTYFFLTRRMHVVGWQHLPNRRTPVLIICNHASLLDTLYLACAIKPRFTVCGAKPKYFTTRRARLLTAIGNVMKVTERFEDECVQLLRSGEVVLMYPEMGRNPVAMGNFAVYAANVALRANVPVVPCYIDGTRPQSQGPISLRVGVPIVPSGSPAELTEVFRRAVTSLQECSADGIGGLNAEAS